MDENEFMRRYQLAAAKNGARLFRNNVGQGWTGKLFRPHMATSVTIHPGDVVLKSARPLHAGLCEGSSDLIGWKTKIITQDMVGLPIAVFMAREIKRPRGPSKTTQAQINFIEAIRRAGGDAEIVKGLMTDGLEDGLEASEGEQEI